MPISLLVTGGLGFIGSRFIDSMSAEGARVTNIDIDTYAGDVRRLGDSDTVTLRQDVADPDLIELMSELSPEVIVHFAAETHVTRSEVEGDAFYRTNVEGTRNVMEAAVTSRPGRVIHVSTDEVYGSCEDKPFSEQEKMPGEGRATSAYARSKGIADDVALSYSDRVPVIVVRPTNCFGPYQHPEKAVPRWVIRAISGRRLPVWGDGRQIRDWMYVDDCCAAIRLLLDQGSPGEAYNIGPESTQVSNLEIARTIARAADRSEKDVYLTAYDRPQHDRRYAIDASKLRALGWKPSQDLNERLAQTVDWYRHHEEWWAPLLEEAETLYEDGRERTL